MEVAGARKGKRSNMRFCKLNIEEKKKRAHELTMMRRGGGGGCSSSSEQGGSSADVTSCRSSGKLRKLQAFFVDFVKRKERRERGEPRSRIVWRKKRR